MKYCIYKHTFPDGKVYIGQTVSGRQEMRWSNGNGYKVQKKVYDAISLYGWENISHEILADDLTKNRANLLEQLYIVAYQSVRNGYNVKGPGKRIKQIGNVGNYIKAAAVWNGKSIKDVASQMGIAEDTLYRKLQGVRRLSVADLIAAEKAVAWTKYLEVMQ